MLLNAQLNVWHKVTIIPVAKHSSHILSTAKLINKQLLNKSVNSLLTLALVSPINGEACACERPFKWVMIWHFADEFPHIAKNRKSPEELRFPARTEVLNRSVLTSTYSECLADGALMEHISTFFNNDVVC